MFVGIDRSRTKYKGAFKTFKRALSSRQFYYEQCASIEFYLHILGERPRKRVIEIIIHYFVIQSSVTAKLI